jgi:DNA helicase II / ATP-dependent DNA helicase PcrA
VPAGEAHAFANGKGAELYAAYQARLKTLNAADFGDLLLEPCACSRKTRTSSPEYQKRFKYMLVDEYQDTNVAQYLLAAPARAGHRNICCVGDDDQSIYGWRGAEVDNILRFEKDFPGAKSSGWSATTARPATSSPRPPASSPTTRAGSARRCTPTTTTGRQGHRARPLGRRRGGPRHRRGHRALQREGHMLDGIAILVRASSRCAPSRTASSRSACPTG